MRDRKLTLIVAVVIVLVVSMCVVLTFLRSSKEGAEPHEHEHAAQPNGDSAAPPDAGRHDREEASETTPSHEH